MKKAVLTFLLGASLLGGVNNQLKGQGVVDIYNNKEVLASKKEGYAKTHKSSILYYADKDNDNFYETIRVITGKQMKFLTFEEFYLDKETGSINVNYTIQKYQLNKKEWNNLPDNFYKMITCDLEKNATPYYRKFYQNLTAQDISALGGERFTKRLTNIINASKNKILLENMIKAEIYR